MHCSRLTLRSVRGQTALIATGQLKEASHLESNIARGMNQPCSALTRCGPCLSLALMHVEFLAVSSSQCARVSFAAVLQGNVGTGRHHSLVPSSSLCNMKFSRGHLNTFIVLLVPWKWPNKNPATEYQRTNQTPISQEIVAKGCHSQNIFIEIMCVWGVQGFDLSVWSISGSGSKHLKQLEWWHLFCWDTSESSKNRREFKTVFLNKL